MVGPLKGDGHVDCDPNIVAWRKEKTKKEKIESRRNTKNKTWKMKNKEEKKIEKKKGGEKKLKKGNK